jgi:hypothetical protein
MIEIDWRPAMERSKFEHREAGAEEDTSRADETSDNWVDELIAMTRPGVEINFPVRRIDDRPIPFAYDDFN